MSAKALISASKVVGIHNLILATEPGLHFDAIVEKNQHQPLAIQT